MVEIGSLGVQDGNFDAESVVPYPGRTDGSRLPWFLGERMCSGCGAQVACPHSDFVPEVSGVSFNWKVVCSVMG